MFSSQQRDPARLRRIRDRDAAGRRRVFLTNHMTRPAWTVCELSRLRWQVELFFKWITQHLRITRFFGTSENAVNTQVWIAVSVYVLVAIIRKRLDLEMSLHSMRQILRVTPFENVSLRQLLTDTDPPTDPLLDGNQLTLL